MRHIYSKTITVFNYYESPMTGEGIWYPHVLIGVDLNTDRGAIIKKYGHDTADNAQLHVTYYMHATDPEDDRKLVNTADGMLPWIPPKQWKKQINDNLSKTVTFSPESDFFIEGIWDGGIVSDNDYRGGFYQYMNHNKDNAFKITSVGGPYSLIPHFEILAK